MIDFNEFFSQMVRHASIALWHSELQEEIVMQQPGRYVTLGKKDNFFLLKNSLYSLKQSSRQWYLGFHSFIIKHVYNRLWFFCVL